MPCQDLLRQRRRPVAAEEQDDRHPGLRLAGPRPCPEPARQRLQGDRGQRPGSANYDLAVKHGFEPLSADEATKQADIINILLPDEVQGDIFRSRSARNLKPGNILMCSHGFNVHFGQVEAPEGVDTVLVAPKGPGPPGAQRIRKGGGVPCLIALSEGASETLASPGPGLCQGHRRHAAPA